MLYLAEKKPTTKSTKSKLDPKEENIHAGHRKRMKAQFRKNGINAFNEHQILEFLLFFSIPRKDTNPTGHRLINKFGSAHAVFSAPKKELMKVYGIGPRSAELISSIPDITSALLNREIYGVPMNDMDFVSEYLKEQFADNKNEGIWMISLDNQMRMLRMRYLFDSGVERVFQGRSGIFTALKNDRALRFMLVHNRPDKTCMCTREEFANVDKLKRVMHDLGLEFVEHVIIGKDGIYFAVSRRFLY